MNARSLATLSLLLGIISLAPAQHVSSEITADELKAHVKYLASDQLEGRKSGTEGNSKAAAYIADQFKLYGMKPAGERGSYLQPFDFVSSVKLGEKNHFVLYQDGERTVLSVDEDFRPFGFSLNGEVSGPVVFAGYGISAPDKNYDDYGGIDVNGKIVVALRFGPDGNDPHSELNRFTSLRNKARTARDKGAIALIIMTGPNDEEQDELVKLSYDNSFATSGIAAVSIKRKAIEQLLKGTGKDLKNIQNTIKESKKPMSFDLPGAKADVKTDVVKVMATTANVAGYWEGNDPKLKDQVLIVGAHFDHLGRGGPGSGSLTPDTNAIHHGADDNASGTAAMLELAQAFGANTRPARTLLFLGFSGEELGTLGSAYYVNNPFFPLKQTIAMLNMDEVGRLQNNTLTIYGLGTSPEWNRLVRKYNTGSPTSADTFTLKTIPDGFGPSDHSQFYGKDIPVLFFFTGTHSDYHKPSDEWDKINYQGEERIVRYIYAIAKEIEGQPDPPQFVKAPASAPMGGGDTRGFNVTLGTIPDYGENIEGMKIGGVRPNGPAEKAGLKAGDIIVRMAGKKVMNIYDFMGILGELKPDQEVEVEVTRNGTPIKVLAKVAKR